MNTISIPTMSRMNSSRNLAPFQTAMALTAPATRPLPTWLPAPPSNRAKTTTVRRRDVKPAFNSRGEFRAEKLLMLVLAIVAVSAIGYGFSSLVDLVQNWALFNVGVGHLIQ